MFTPDTAYRWTLGAAAALVLLLVAGLLVPDRTRRVEPAGGRRRCRATAGGRGHRHGGVRRGGGRSVGGSRRRGGPGSPPGATHRRRRAGRRGGRGAGHRRGGARGGDAPQRAHPLVGGGHGDPGRHRGRGAGRCGTRRAAQRMAGRSMATWLSQARKRLTGRPTASRGRSLRRRPPRRSGRRRPRTPGGARGRARTTPSRRCAPGPEASAVAYVPSRPRTRGASKQAGDGSRQHHPHGQLEAGDRPEGQWAGDGRRGEEEGGTGEDETAAGVASQPTREPRRPSLGTQHQLREHHPHREVRPAGGQPPLDEYVLADPAHRQERQGHASPGRRSPRAGGPVGPDRDAGPAPGATRRTGARCRRTPRSGCSTTARTRRCRHRAGRCAPRGPGPRPCAPGAVPGRPPPRASPSRRAGRERPGAPRTP